MKNIITTTGVIERMEFNEVLDRYSPLINKRCNRWSNLYEYDDLYQTSSIALWRAYDAYDVNRNITFGYVATKYVDFALMAYHNKHKSRTERNTSVVKKVISMDAPIGFLKSGEAATIEDMLGEEDAFTDNIADKEIVDRLLNMFHGRQRQELIQIAKGYEMKHIAKSEGVTKQALGRRIKGTYERCRAVLANMEV